ncbi:MAG TPA: glutamate racemase [Methylophilaceae bacterium]|nr:glutamate racemase [Methylophilaceae bacterium]
MAISPSASAQPIGVFDSGVGGISVLKHIHALMPYENLLYVADSANAPYGSKPQDFICERAIAISDFLIEQGAKALVVACNTATAAAINAMRERYELPIIGMEPAVKPAAEATKTGVIGVLATVGTLKSAQFAALLEHYGQGVEVVTEGCPGLVECIERGELASPGTSQLLRAYIKPLLLAGADTIVLGCTHYPFVKPLIQEIAGPEITLIDTGDAVARQVQKRLAENNALRERPKSGWVRFWSNSLAGDAGKVVSSLWGRPAELESLPLQVNDAR